MMRRELLQRVMETGLPAAMAAIHTGGRAANDDA
jgi:hypothetical protein